MPINQSNIAQKRFNLKKFAAFTLAEVLITLGIIGIVAAMTIPTLMQNIQDYQLKQAWKKTFSDFSQVGLSMDKDYGSIIAARDAQSPTSADQKWQEAFCQYLNCTQKCVQQNVTQGCWYPTIKNLNGTSAAVPDANATVHSAVLSNGAIVLFITGSWVQILVDVNGKSPPNTSGRDIFSFDALALSNDLIRPYGWNLVTSCPGGTGADCSAIYLYQ